MDAQSTEMWWKEFEERHPPRGVKAGKPDAAMAGVDQSSAALRDEAGALVDKMSDMGDALGDTLSDVTARLKDVEDESARITKKLKKLNTGRH